VERGRGQRQRQQDDREHGAPLRRGLSDRPWLEVQRAARDERDRGPDVRSPGALTLDGFPRSGADWLERFKPYIEDGKTIVVSPHRVWGPQTNDLALQLRKRRIAKVIAVLSTDEGVMAMNASGARR